MNLRSVIRYIFLSLLSSMLVYFAFAYNFKDSALNFFQKPPHVPFSFHSSLPTNKVHSQNVAHIVESLVSVGIELSDGEFRHLVGGFVVHPGVVLTYIPPEIKSYYKKLLRIKDHSFSQLYIEFFSQNKHVGKVRVSVQSQRAWKALDNPLDVYSSYFGLTLLFFDVPSQISSISALNFSSAYDFAHSYEILDNDFIGVGVWNYSGNFPIQEKSKIPVCPDSSYSYLASMSFTRDPRYYKLLALMVEAFPGKIASYLWPNLQLHLYKEQNKAFDQRLDFFASEFREELFQYYHALMCNDDANVICTDQSSLYSNMQMLQFQCAEHTGYPLLWRASSQSPWKVIAISGASHYVPRMDIARISGPDASVEQMHQSMHLDAIFFKTWIKNQILDQKKYLQLDKNILSNLNDADDIFQTVQSPQKYFVHLAEKVSQSQKKDHFYRRFCSGVLIADNAVLTAAHCISHLSLQEDHNYYALLHGAWYVDTPVKIVDYQIHPKYAVLDESYYRLQQQQLQNPEELTAMIFKYDLGIVFLDPFVDVPSAHTISIKSYFKQDLWNNVQKNIWKVFVPKHSKRRFARKKGYAAYSLDYHQAMQDYALLPAMVLNDFDSYIFRDIDDMLEQLISSESMNIDYLLSKIFEITGENIRALNIAAISDRIKLSDIRKNTHDLFSRIECDQDGLLCFFPDKAKNRRVQHYAICQGDSGAPLIVYDGRESAVVGILSSLRLMDLNSEICGSFAVAVDLSEHQNWIQETLRQGM